MKNIQIMNQADKIMAEWVAAGENGFFLDFYTSKTDHQLGDKEYSLVYDMLMDGLL